MQTRSLFQLTVFRIGPRPHHLPRAIWGVLAVYLRLSAALQCIHTLQEAAVLEGCVRLLVESCGLQPGQLGVITPYATQVALLSKRLQRGGFNVNGSGGSGGWDGEDV